MVTVHDLLKLSAEQRRAVIAALPPVAAERLLYDWGFWARDKQLLPDRPFSVLYLKGGRGSGKTRAGAEAVRQWQKQGYGYFALVGQTPGDVRDVMIEGEAGLLAISPPWNKPEYEPTKRRLTWPNGAVATTFSGANPDELRGPSHMKAWVDELPTFKFAREVWDNLLMGLRLGDNPQIVLTTTPKPTKLLKEIQSDSNTITVISTSFENRANLPPAFFQRIINRYEGTRTGLQEIYAQDLDEAEGALWKRSYIRYVTTLPQMQRIVVAIDPAVTSSEESDETGIIVAGKGEDGLGYVLRDASGRLSPNAWAEKAIQQYLRLRADLIVAEVNNGGDMVGNTIKTVKAMIDGVEVTGTTIPFKAVHATRGKAVRAEPVAALYEQGKILHVPGMPDLEDQLCTWVPGDDKSPDRLDALVWAFTELMVTGGSPNLRFIG